MPRKKKKLTEKTTEETIKKLFPKKVIEEAKKESHKKVPKSLLIKVKKMMPCVKYIIAD